MAVDYALIDSALYSEGRRDRTFARRPRSLFGAARLAPPHSRRPWHRQCIRLRIVCGDGRFLPATCSAIGIAGIPEMRKRGYSPGFAAGIIAAGGTLGILLPPSITMILYAVAAEESLGRLSSPALRRGCFLLGYSRFIRVSATPRSRRRRCGISRRMAAPASCEEHTRCAKSWTYAAACSSLRAPADRRHDRALWRLCHALGDGRPRRACSHSF